MLDLQKFSSVLYTTHKHIFTTTTYFKCL